MKKLALTRIIIWSIAAIILLSIMLLVMVGKFSFSIVSFYNSGFNGEVVTDGKLSIDQNIEKLEIGWISGDIDINLYDGNTIEVIESGTNISEDERMIYKLSDKRLQIGYWKDKTSFLNKTTKHLEIKIPHDMVQLLYLKIDSVSSELTINDINVDELKIDSVSGRINLFNNTVHILEIDTVSGRITADQFTADQIKIGGVSAKTDLILKNCPSAINYNTVRGNLTLNLYDNEGFTVKKNTVSGKFSCDFPTKEKNDIHTYKDGKSTFDFDSVSGSFYIKERK